MAGSLAGHLGKDKLDFRVIDPSEFVHCCIDAQREFCDPQYKTRRGNEETARVSGHIAEVAPKFRAAGIPTFMVYFSWDKSVKPQKAGGGFYKVKPEAGDVMIPKDADSAFKGSDIKEQLESRGIKTLVVSGFNTNACVLRTVRDALSEKFNVWLMRDCVGNDNRNSSCDKESIAEMRDKGAEITDHEAVLARIDNVMNASPVHVANVLEANQPRL